MDKPLELMAIARFTQEAIGCLLQLPAGAYIDAVEAPFGAHGTLSLRIRGAGWPAGPGDVIQQTVPSLTTHHAADGGVKVEIDWGFPP